ncbi:hypothetical protein M3Y96_00431200 [Aphelenchoides besseyi]|nr:hypothetical protein M3Y96_00431200 [Aphelenchoides besseyi]
MNPHLGFHLYHIDHCCDRAVDLPEVELRRVRAFAHRETPESASAIKTESQRRPTLAGGADSRRSSETTYEYAEPIETDQTSAAGLI